MPDTPGELSREPERGAQEPNDTPLAVHLSERWRGGLIIAALVATFVILGRLSPFEPLSDALESFDWVTERAIRIAKELFERYGYLTVFLAPMLENTIFLGALIPGTLVMLLAGLSANEGLISFWPAVLLGVCGAIIGDTISYGIGRFGWQRLGPETRIVKWSERMRGPLIDHSVWLILSYHFAGYSRLIGPAASGFLRIPFLRWALLDYVGVTAWVLVFLSAGYALGAAGLSLDESDRNVQIFELILFGFFIIAILTILRAANRAAARRRPEETRVISAAGASDGRAAPVAPEDEALERVP
jgi:membrane protein DedA with SNARE-associated domain